MSTAVSEADLRELPAGTAAPADQTANSRLLCQRCGFPVPRRVMGCKNPCGNCGTIYPLGDCSD